MSKISVKNLDLYYGDFKALKNINLEIEPNKITAFIGPSGCGKSTLLKSINRMNDLVEGCRIDGEILLDGQNIFKGMDVNVLRKRVGMVFQKPNPFPMSIYDNVAYGPRTHGIRKKSELDRSAFSLSPLYNMQAAPGASVSEVGVYASEKANGHSALHPAIAICGKCACAGV